MSKVDRVALQVAREAGGVRVRVVRGAVEVAAAPGVNLGEAFALAAQNWVFARAEADRSTDWGEALDRARGDWLRSECAGWASALASWAREEGVRAGLRQVAHG